MRSKLYLALTLSLVVFTTVRATAESPLEDCSRWIRQSNLKNAPDVVGSSLREGRRRLRKYLEAKLNPPKPKPATAKPVVHHRIAKATPKETLKRFYIACAVPEEQMDMPLLPLVPPHPFRIPERVYPGEPSGPPQLTTNIPTVPATFPPVATQEPPPPPTAPPVPEPGTLLLVGSGALSLFHVARKRLKK